MTQEYTPVSWQDETTSQQGTLINAERLNQMQTAHHYADGWEEVDAVPTADPGVSYHKVVYCTADSTFYRWDGTEWTADIDDETKRLLQEEIARATEAERTIEGYLDAHEANHNNPHVVTKSQVGLGNCDNTADLDKPISTATQAALDGKADKATTLAGYGITDAYTKSQADVLLATKAPTTALTDGSVTKVGTSDVGSDTKPIKLVGGVPTAVADTLATQTYVGNALDGYLPMVRTTDAQTIAGAKTFSDVLNVDNFIRSKHKVLNTYSVDTTLGRWVPIYSIDRSGQSSPQVSFYIALRKNGYALIQVILPASGSLKIQGVVIGSARAPADLFRVSAEDSNTWTLWAYFASDDGIRADCLGAYGSNTQLAGSNITPLSVTTGYTITSEGYTDENGVVHTFTAYAEMGNDLVHTSGDETIEGLKTFKGSSNISRLIYMQSNVIEQGTLPGTTRYETIEFVDKNTTPNTLNRMGEMGYRLESSGLSAMYLRAYRYDGSNNGQFDLITLADGTQYMKGPYRTYNASNTTDVATIGTLDAYTPMIRTTGNQTKAGQLILQGTTNEQRLTIKSTNIDVNNPGSGTRNGSLMSFTDVNDNWLAYFYVSQKADKTTQLIAWVRNADGTSKSIILAAGDV